MTYPSNSTVLRLRQDDHAFESSVDYTVRTHLPKPKFKIYFSVYVYKHRERGVSHSSCPDCLVVQKPSCLPPEHWDNRQVQLSLAKATSPQDRGHQVPHLLWLSPVLSLKLALRKMKCLINQFIS